MAKNISQTVQPSSQPTTAEGQSDVAEIIAQETPQETAEIVAFQGKPGSNGFAAFNARQSDAIKNKVKLVNDAKAQLQRAADAAAEAAKHAGKDGNNVLTGKVAEPAAKGGLLLFNGMSQGVLSNDEVTDILGSTFGFKTKKDGTDSKTPVGIGEEIRKRVQRAYKAYDYAINGNEPVAFFEPLEREDVVPLINRVVNGDLGLWEFYNQSGELKAEKTGKRPKAAFDPRRIAAMTRDWGANINETVAIVQRTPGLFAAMAGALRMLETIGSLVPVPGEQTESEAA